MSAEDTSGSCKLTELGSQAWSMTREAFAAQFGHVFLVHHGALRSEHTPTPTPAPQSTARATRQTVTIDPTALQRQLSKPRGESVVYFVRSSGRTAFAGQIWIGRARNNDIVIPDITVSEAHAYFRETDRRWHVFDARSRNGTFVDEIPVRPAGSLEVSPGSRVRFGSVGLEFLAVDDLIELVRRVATRPPPGTGGG